MSEKVTSKFWWGSRVMTKNGDRVKFGNSLIRLYHSMSWGHHTAPLSLHFTLLGLHSPIYSAKRAQMERSAGPNRQQRPCFDKPGKRPHYYHYYDGHGSVLTGSVKRERVTPHALELASNPRCQVDGCGTELVEEQAYLLNSQDFN